VYPQSRLLTYGDHPKRDFHNASRHRSLISNGTTHQIVGGCRCLYRFGYSRETLGDVRSHPHSSGIAPPCFGTFGAAVRNLLCVSLTLSMCPKKTMYLAARRRDGACSCRPIFVRADDVAARVDPKGYSKKRVWEIKRGEFATAQEKAVNVPIASETACP